MAPAAAAKGHHPGDAATIARQINANPRVEGLPTRDTDVFSAAQRNQKSRAAKADLFVSIHADAFTNPAASGSSVFVLSQRGASSQAARWLASQENAADLVGGVRLQDKDNTLASVLLDLSQSATMKASEDMAGHVLSGLKTLGKTHKAHVNAQFLSSCARPTCRRVVETAFSTNPWKKTPPQRSAPPDPTGARDPRRRQYLFHPATAARHDVRGTGRGRDEREPPRGGAGGSP